MKNSGWRFGQLILPVVALFFAAPALAQSNLAVNQVTDVIDDPDTAAGLNTPAASAMVQVGGNNYLLTVGESATKGSALSVFTIGSNGRLANVSNIFSADLATGVLNNPFDVTTAMIGGKTFVFTASDSDAVSVFSLADNGALTFADSATDSDNAAFLMGSLSGVVTADVEGTTYLFASGRADNGVSVFSVSTTGMLTNVFNLADDSTIALLGASDVETAQLINNNNVDFLFVTGEFDNGISVFQISPDGSLTHIQTTIDVSTLELEGAESMAIAVAGGNTFVFVAGRLDDGISVFQVVANGTLSNVANVTDDATLGLDNVKEMASAVVAGTTYLFAGSTQDESISVFSIDGVGNFVNVDNFIDFKTAGGNNNTFGGLSAGIVGNQVFMIGPNKFAAGNPSGQINVFSVAADGKLTNTFQVTDAGLLELDDADSVATANIGGTTYLFVTGVVDNGISVFSVGTNGVLTNTDNVTDTGVLELFGADRVITTVVGGTTFVIVAASVDDGISVFSVSAAGKLTSTSNVSDDATLELNGAKGLTSVSILGTTYLYVAASIDDGVAVFALAADGTLTIVENVTDDAMLELNGASSVTTAVVGNTTYLFVSGQADNGIAVFSIGPDGKLVSASNFPDTATTNLESVQDVATVVVGGTTYLLAPGIFGVSVFSVANNGTLTNVDNVADDGVLALDVGTTVTTAVVEGITYVFFGSEGDDGFSVFKIANDGKLSAVSTTIDNTILQLRGLRDLEIANVGGNQFLFAAGRIDNGVSVFSVAPEFPMTTVFSSVLPAARSGFVGGGAITVFASAINAGATLAKDCKIVIPGGGPVTLSFQETDATNTPIGTPDQMFDMAPSTGKSFVLAFTPLSTSNGVDLLPNVACLNANVDPILGVNTVFLTVGAVAVPDILSISSTPDGSGIITVPTGSISFMSVAATNIGVGDSAGSKDAAITVSVDDGGANLPLLLQLCETDALGTCITTLGTGAVATTIGAGPSFFAVFPSDAGSGGIALDPANSRVFIRFTDAGGTVRSVTSAAVQVQ